MPNKDQKPGAADYDVPSDSIYFDKHSVTHTVNEPRFFSPKNMRVVKAQVPVQYTAQDGVSPQSDSNLNATSRGSLLSGYFGGSQTSRYRQVDIGRGKRYDFTTANIKNKADANYAFEKFGSIANNLQKSKEKSTKKNDTFYATMERWEPAVVTTGLNHYLGKGTANHNGLGLQNYEKVESLTKFSSPRLAISNADRGLLMPSTKQMRFGHLGPGSYTDSSMNAIIEKSFRRK
jgi:hypothetical protein